MNIKLYDNPTLDRVTELAEEAELFFDAVDEVEWAVAATRGEHPDFIFETWKASRA